MGIIGSVLGAFSNPVTSVAGNIAKSLIGGATEDVNTQSAISSINNSTNNGIRIMEAQMKADTKLTAAQARQQGNSHVNDAIRGAEKSLKESFSIS